MLRLRVFWQPRLAPYLLHAPSSTFTEEMRSGVSSDGDGENYQKQFKDAFFFAK
jgi:hypothetical protein